ncbi:hypothetical protein [Streptomyces sp. NPDC089915]|uniref:ATP-dependent DNA ligase n=1 Tax=Streptomyces sp. NPDC089915 TaxID=3155186 RepID=UPI003446104C
MAYEQKLDGHRAILFTTAGLGGAVVVQPWRGALVQDRWPDPVAAAQVQLPAGLVLDGELVAWDTEAGALSFGALQRRAATRARGAAALAAKWPAYFVAFDVLQQGGQELLTRPYAAPFSKASSSTVLASSPRAASRPVVVTMVSSWAWAAVRPLHVSLVLRLQGSSRRGTSCQGRTWWTSSVYGC